VRSKVKWVLERSDFLIACEPHGTIAFLLLSFEMYVDYVYLAWQTLYIQCYFSLVIDTLLHYII
jgi:hypothetical protein